MCLCVFVCSLTACALLRGRVVVVGTLDVGVLGGVAHLQHWDILGVVGLLHVHVVAFALEGQDHVAVGRDGEKEKLSVARARARPRPRECMSEDIYLCAVMTYMPFSESVTASPPAEVLKGEDVVQTSVEASIKSGYGQFGVRFAVRHLSAAHEPRLLVSPQARINRYLRQNEIRLKAESTSGLD